MSKTKPVITKPILDEIENKESIAYNLIKDAISDHKFPTEAIISERKLSEMFNMSRTPIRDALKQLTHEGLLKFVPGKGVMVPEYTVEDILEVYSLIELLQLYAAHSCIQRLNNIPIDHLKLIVDKMKDSLDSQNLNEFVDWDKSFHSFLISNSGNNRLSGIYLPLDNQSSQFKAAVSEELSQAERSYTEHVKIYESIITSNNDEAENAIKLHYKDIKQYHINKLFHL